MGPSIIRQEPMLFLWIDGHFEEYQLEKGEAIRALIAMAQSGAELRGTA